MRPEDADFLKAYLREFPELAEQVRVEPPSALCDGVWRRINRLKTQGSSLLLGLAGGRRMQLIPERRISALRERYRESLMRLLRRHFPRYRVLGVNRGTDRVRHQPASLLRVQLCDGSKRLAALLAYPGQSPELADRLFSALILWWDHLSRSNEEVEAALFIPESWNERLLDRFPYLRIPASCYKYRLAEAGDSEVTGSQIRKIYPTTVKRTEVRSPYVIFPFRHPAPALLRQIQQQHPCLDLSLRHGRWELCCLGLPVAWHEGGAEFGFDFFNPEPLDAGRLASFEEHLKEVVGLRCFPTPDCHHPFYRFRPERWLEALLLRNHRMVVNRRLSETVYSQVPSCVEGDRKVLDLISVTDQGQLVVIELKVEKDLDLIFQALDYWERVSRHLERGDFQRCGYFPGQKLQPDRRPLLYLISPLFEFHRVMPALRRSLRDEVRFHCVGINSDWRSAIRVLRRFEF